MGNFTQNVNYRHSPTVEFMWLPESVEGLPSQGRGMGTIFKTVYLLENYIGKDDGNVVVSEVKLVCTSY